MASIVVTAAPRHVDRVMQIVSPRLYVNVQAPQSAIPHPNFVPVILKRPQHP